MTDAETPDQPADFPGAETGSFPTATGVPPPAGQAEIMLPLPRPGPQEDPLPTVPGYDVLRVLGSGGMGVVLQARHRVLGRVVALKVIREERLSRPESLKRFHREARAAARLAHPNLAAIYDAGEAGGKPFLALEYVEGVTLACLVREGGPLPVPLACEYIRQAALGLQHIHEKGLVHRDVKPSNLMLVSGGQGHSPTVK